MTPPESLWPLGEPRGGWIRGVGPRPLLLSKNPSQGEPRAGWIRGVGLRPLLLSKNPSKGEPRGGWIRGVGLRPLLLSKNPSKVEDELPIQAGTSESDPRGKTPPYPWNLTMLIALFHSRN